MDINEKIQQLITQNDLGTGIISIQKISGGLSHKIYRVRTDKADYAIKELNPAIMRKKDAYRNFVFSEKVARTARQNGINAVCALQFCGDVVLKVGDSFFMVFKWLNATTLTAEQVDEKHCIIIGQTLAKLHNINFCKPKNIQQNTQKTSLDINHYITLSIEQNKPYAQRLQRDADLLLKLRKRAAAATNDLNGDLTVSHADLDCKNVMWQGFTPFIIDWESSGCINPSLELVQVAWYWAGGDIENLVPSKFETVIKSYLSEYRGKLCTDYAALVYANIGPKLAWLEYNLTRAFVETDEFAEIADNEVDKSLKETEYCVDLFDAVIKILKNCF